MIVFSRSVMSAHSGLLPFRRDRRSLKPGQRKRQAIILQVTCHWVPGSLRPWFIVSRVHCVPGSMFATFMQLFLQLYATFLATVFCNFFAHKNCNLFCNFFATFCCKKKVAKSCKKVANKLPKKVANKLQQTCKKLPKKLHKSCKHIEPGTQ